MTSKRTPIENKSSSIFDSASLKELSSTYGDQTPEGPVVSRISVWAVVSVVLGLLGFLALVQLGFLFFSVLGAFAALVAFYAIGRSGGELGGRKLTALGLVLALASGIAGPYSTYVYTRDFDRQADAFCRYWFDAVKTGDPALPHQTTAPYWQRKTFTKHRDSVSYWRPMMIGDEEEHHMVHSYLSNPTLLTIHRLGDRAKVTFFGTSQRLLTKSTEQAERVYAVTVEPEEPGGKRQTFFLSFLVERIMRTTPQGEVKVGWTMKGGDYIPLKLGADGLPVLSQNVDSKPVPAKSHDHDHGHDHDH